MVIMMHGMMNGTMHGMMNGSMHGMGWGESIVSLLFTVLVFAVLILTIMAILKYLRNKDKVPIET